jgi:hypothetical protein
LQILPTPIILSIAPTKAYSFSAISAFLGIGFFSTRRVRNLNEVCQYIATYLLDMFKKVVIQAFMKGYSYKFFKELGQNK